MNTEEWKKNKCADCDNLVSITDWSEGNDPRKYCDKCYDDDNDEDYEGEYLETKMNTETEKQQKQLWEDTMDFWIGLSENIQMKSVGIKNITEIKNYVNI